MFGLVRVPRAGWYEINKGITHAVKNWKITAITLSGSSEPGSFAILEHENSFNLAVDPPANLKPHFPPGAKAGDRVNLVNLGVLWFDKEGKISKELVYGRLAWPEFSLDSFHAGSWYPRWVWGSSCRHTFMLKCDEIVILLSLKSNTPLKSWNQKKRGDTRIVILLSL